MPSSLPTREEVVRDIVAAYEDVTRGTTREVVGARVNLPLLCALYPVVVAEEARQAEAPNGETETGEGQSPRDGACSQVSPNGRHVCTRNDGHGGEHVARESNGAVLSRWFDAPPSVPVSTERPDGETDGLGPGLDDEWTVMGGANLNVENDEDLSTLRLDGHGNYMVATCGPADRARLVRALGGTTVPASLPPLTEEAVRAASTVIAQRSGYRLTESTVYAALASTGRYASPEEQAEVRDV